MFIGQIINSLCMLVWPNIFGHDFAIEHLDNRINEDMNDFHSIDFAKRDWLEDHDFTLVRATQEFPRLSLAYQRRTNKGNKVPWGSSGKPVHTLIENDECMIMLLN